MYIKKYIYIYINKYVYIYIGIDISIFIEKYIYTYCKYTYTYIFTHIYAQALMKIEHVYWTWQRVWESRAFPQSFHDSTPIHDSATVFCIAMTIQEVSSWHPGHTKSKHFPIFGIFLLFAVTARHLKKPKTTTTFKVFMGRFLVFFFPLSHSLSFSLSVVLESILSTRFMDIISF